MTVSLRSAFWSGGRWVAALVACALVACALLCASAGLAQEKKKSKGDEHIRSVHGLVTDAEDKPVSGAVVQLKNTKTLQIRSFITQDNGSYYFHELSTDVDYDLRADYHGASSPTKSLSSFDSRKDATLDLKLKK